MKKHVLTLLMVAVLLVVCVSPANAQSSYTLHVTFGNAADPGTYLWTNYSFIHGSTGSPGNPSPSAISAGDGVRNSVRTEFVVNLPPGCLVSEVELDWNFEGDDTISSIVLGYRTTVGGSNIYWWEYFQNGFPQNVWQNDSYVQSPAAAAQIYVWHEAQGAPKHAYVDNVKITCSGISEPGGAVTIGNIFQPIAEELQVDVVTPRSGSGLVNGASRITAETSRAMLGATPVYASITGTIGNVTPNSIELLGEVDGEEWEVRYGNLEKIYVQPGDEVDAGCIIALAAPATTATDESESYDLKGLAFRIINLDLETFEDWETFSSPSGTQLCGSLVKGESCLNANPYLNNNADGWNLTPSDTGNIPQRRNGGITLNDNQSMFQYAALDAGETYYVTISATMLEVPVGGRSALLNVELGDSFHNHSIYADLPGDIPKGNPAPGEQQVFVVGPFEPTTPNLAPDLYALSIENTATVSKVEINYVCLSESDTSPVAPYSSCYFDELGDFTTTGATMHDTFGNEFIALDDTESITYEDLTLSGYDDADAEYHVEVMLSASDEDQTSTAASTSPELTLSFDDGTEYAVVNSITIPYYVRQFKMVVFTIEIPEDDTVTADLVIAHDQQASTDSEFIYVSNICLVAPTGWPGYDSSPGGGGGGGGGGSGSGGSGGGSGSCAPIIAPLSTDVWEWVAWLFASLTQFFKCVLPAELLKILNAVTAIGTAIADIGRWLMAVIQLLASWLFALLGWLVTTLSNALITIFAALWSAITQIPLFTEFFDIWSLVGLLIEGVTAALMAAINLVLLGFKTLATFAQIILAFWGSLVAAMNDSTTASTGLPDCDTILDTDLWYPTCLTIDLLSYIIAAFPNTQIAISAAGALLAIYTLIKTVAWYRESFAEVA